ncbi:DUF1801 domain-containing protein [Jiangella sp. DSM 45060]|uniref:DUF1801 domain-containing protein n=1 Tax=Jiangella sp. DSM 45060 TaxID=1798224 RepID=UPI00087C52CC|nr:DUF1801 domain-containing protein [Jiangella sp. DSM 45060]SDS43732.1 hypothetical protein SAMN04515669_1099 [Jiangella sp. DSM 45060]
MTTEAIETYVQTRIAPAHQPIVASLRELMRTHAPEAAEVIMYGSLAWKARKALAIISASKTHLTFAFERGAEFTDTHGLLDGVGKKTRHVKLKKLEDVDEAALSDYITQAVRLDQT